MRVYLFCTLPGVVESPLESGTLRRARQAGALDIETYDLHSLSPEPHGKIDDYPYGGGPGMVLRVDVVADALGQVFGMEPERVRDTMPVILLTPQGARFDQSVARRLAGEERMVLVCGRYEGVDERIREHLAGEELSIGDYVLSGGELAAAVVMESVARLLPGVLGNRESLNEESFSGPLLEYPQYTRPANYSGWEVPEVLLSGDHARIREWRREQARNRTRDRRPDLLD